MDTIYERISDLVADAVDGELNEKVGYLVAFSSGIDGSAYITDIAQLEIITHGVDACLSVTE